MNISRWARKKAGFTIVELLIVIVVIAILAAITIVAFNGVQARVRVATLQNDLAATSRLMAATHADTGAYPGVLPPDVQPSKDVRLELITTQGGYSNLSPVQNGVLFQAVCQSLINEGYGSGVNNGGGTEHYITGCHVYNRGWMQINGWSAHNFTAPISSSSVYDWYNANVATEAWRPNKKQIFLDFATELSQRFSASGGTFPVASFWDSWANSTNGGQLREELPAPSTETSDTTFCIEATHAALENTTWHVKENGKPTAGAC